MTDALVQMWPTLPIADYVVDKFDGPPSLSSSLAHRLLSRSPLHAWTAHPRLNPAWEPDTDDKFDLGIAAHAVLLEGKRSALAEIDAPDYRKAGAQALRDDARAIGLIPVLTHQVAQIEAMVQVARDTLARCRDLAGVHLPDCLVEHTIRWQAGDAWCRCRPDAVTPDFRLVVSYKTTGNAEPDAFTKHIVSMGYDVQMAFELAGVKALTETTARYVWLAQETEPPYACSLIEPSPDLLDLGAQKYERAVQRWARCLASGVWTAYPDRVLCIDTPAFARANWNEYVNYLEAGWR